MGKEQARKQHDDVYERINRSRSRGQEDLSFSVHIPPTLIFSERDESRMAQMIDLRCILHLFFGCMNLRAIAMYWPLR